MRILLDESAPHDLRLLFPGAHQEIAYQQNLLGRKLAIIVLGTNNWSQIRTHVARILVAIESAVPGSYVEVDIPHA